ncbi:hypothetical protein HME9304_00225 [Flagellimonas maritima]|uniref:Uncharacterized protein n=1 Tax=Flagellimonas maritima TaxID=1383885 RepID=A0A2Z4LPC9_9FLAO|nr:hypothetical protein HME9304_00225 [Allomuricauda aurantiaca]
MMGIRLNDFINVMHFAILLFNQNLEIHMLK